MGWVDPFGLAGCRIGKSLTVNKPKILSDKSLTNAEKNISKDNLPKNKMLLIEQQKEENWFGRQILMM